MFELLSVQVLLNEEEKEEQKEEVEEDQELDDELHDLIGGLQQTASQNQLKQDESQDSAGDVTDEVEYEKEGGVVSFGEELVEVRDLLPHEENDCEVQQNVEEDFQVEKTLLGKDVGIVVIEEHLKPVDEEHHFGGDCEVDDQKEVLGLQNGLVMLGLLAFEAENEEDDVEQGDEGTDFGVVGI